MEVHKHKICILITWVQILASPLHLSDLEKLINPSVPVSIY